VASSTPGMGLGEKTGIPTLGSKKHNQKKKKTQKKESGYFKIVRVLPKKKSARSAPWAGKICQLRSKKQVRLIGGEAGACRNNNFGTSPKPQTRNK